MAFNSIQFALFLASFLGVYWLAPARVRNYLILAASYVFYGWWDWRFCGLLAISTVVDFFVGSRLYSAQSPRARKTYLAMSMTTNLGILGFFKYANFFVDGASAVLEQIGLQSNESSLAIILPVGISFYTFQTMSYTIDIYRREMAPTNDFVAFAAFVSFFPQLVAGPIERASALLPQLEAPRKPLAANDVVSALHLIGLGLLKKVVIADMMARQVDLVYGNVEGATWTALVVGLWAFSLQIYGDFSGYSDIARGSARLLGVELMENFNQPYFAASITEFWKRWHISLSSWLRDYLYISLGGNRKGSLRTLRNLMMTMLLGGLWHGASWTFVVWGAAHGTLLVLERVTGLARLMSEAGGLLRVVGRVVTFHLVAVVWVFFRAADFATASHYLQGLSHPDFSTAAVLTNSMLLVVPALLLVWLVDRMQISSGTHTPAVSWSPAAQGALVGLVGVLIIMFSGGPTVPFIYFQF